jgi:hypothetical protein
MFGAPPILLNIPVRIGHALLYACLEAEPTLVFRINIEER